MSLWILLESIYINPHLPSLAVVATGLLCMLQDRYAVPSVFLLRSGFSGVGVGA